MCVSKRLEGYGRAAMKRGGRVRVQGITQVDRKLPNAHLAIWLIQP